MTHQDAWTGLGSLPPADLKDATLQLHWAVQYLAAAGQTFAEPQADDSHRTATWDAERREFVSAQFAGAYPFRVALRPADLTLQLLDRTAEPLGSFPLAGKPRENGFEWLQQGLANYMGRLPVIDRPEYDVPAHPVGTGAPFSHGLDGHFGVLSAMYESAAEILALVSDGDEAASPVRCWPHHFDIATLLTVEANEAGEATKTVGVGMAPMGGGYDGWYWYVSPWPSPKPEALPPLEGPGGWHTEGWVGAVLTGDALVAMDPSFREPAVRKFVDVSVAAARAALGA